MLIYSSSKSFIFICDFFAGQNNNPTCTSYAVSHAFDESTTATTVLMTLPCTDGDAPPDGTLTFNIISGNDLGHFSINGAGALSLVVAIDYDDFTTPHSLQVCAVIIPIMHPKPGRYVVYKEIIFLIIISILYFDENGKKE